jgi:hypothetical protein
MSTMADAPNREVAPKRPSLMDLGTVLAPWTHIKQIRLVRSLIESKPFDLAEPFPLQHSFDAATTMDEERSTIDVHASLTVSVGDFFRIEAEFLLARIIQRWGNL